LPAPTEKPGKFSTSAEIDMPNCAISELLTRGAAASPEKEFWRPMFVFVVFLAGALLGMRFKVLALIPAVGVVVTAVAWFGTLHGDSISGMLMSIALAWGGLQIGYFCGIVVRYRAAQARLRSLRKTPPEARQPTRAS
jgi:hypothetical protein